VLYMVVESLLEEPAAEKAVSPEASEPSVAKPAPEPAPESPPAPLPEPKEAPRARPSAFGLEAGVLFRTLYLGGSQLTPGAGLALDLRADRSDPHVSIAFGMAIHSPLELSLGTATARLQPFSAELLPSLQGELGSGVVGLFGAGASVTWFSLDASAGEGVRSAASAGGADLAIVVTAGLRMRFSSRIAATLSGALEVDVAPRTFVGDLGGDRHVLAELPRLRPFISLTGTYSLLGSNEPGARMEVD
jgi:hypothetical protein